MNKWIIYFFWWLWHIILILHNVNANECTLQINPKNVINVLNEKFISFMVDSKFLYCECNLVDILSENATKYSKLLSPANIKIFSHENDIIPWYDHDEKSWGILSNWTKLTDFEPVLVMDYNSTNWKPRQHLKVLTWANNLEFKQFTWQLGLEFDGNDTLCYVDDLNTFHAMVTSFDEHEKRWAVIGADVSAESNFQEVKLYTELVQNLVKSIGWIQKNISTLDIDSSCYQNNNPTLPVLLDSGIPISGTIPIIRQRCMKDLEMCGDRCVLDGLEWAQFLGVAARTGFDIIYRTLNKKDFISIDLSYYITVLHKKIIGGRVLDTKIVANEKCNSFSDFYAYCSKQTPGGLSIMGINWANDTETSPIVKLTTGKYNYHLTKQYILSVKEGKIFLNDDTELNINSKFEPSLSIQNDLPKHPIKLHLPPLSVGFWEFPDMNIRSCEKFCFSDCRTVPYEMPLTPANELLQQLIKENIFNHNHKKNCSATDNKSNSIKRKKRFTDGKDGRFWDLIGKRDFHQQSDLFGSLIDKQSDTCRMHRSLPIEINREKIRNLFDRDRFKLPVEHIKEFFKSLSKPDIKMIPLPAPIVPRNLNGANLKKEKILSEQLQYPLSEDQIFESRSNPSLPFRDIYVDDIKIGEQEDGKDYDYVLFDELPRKKSYQINRNGRDKDIHAEIQKPGRHNKDANERVDYYALPKQRKTSGVKFRELFGKDDYDLPYYLQPKYQSNNYEMDENIEQRDTRNVYPPLYVLRHMEPALRQNRDQYSRMKNNFEIYQQLGHPEVNEFIDMDMGRDPHLISAEYRYQSDASIEDMDDNNQFFASGDDAPEYYHNSNNKRFVSKRNVKLANRKSVNKKTDENILKDMAEYLNCDDFYDPIYEDETREEMQKSLLWVDNAWKELDPTFSFSHIPYHNEKNFTRDYQDKWHDRKSKSEKLKNEQLKHKLRQSSEYQPEAPLIFVRTKQGPSFPATPSNNKLSSYIKFIPRYKTKFPGEFTLVSPSIDPSLSIPTLSQPASPASSLVPVGPSVTLTPSPPIYSPASSSVSVPSAPLISLLTCEPGSPSESTPTDQSMPSPTSPTVPSSSYPPESPSVSTPEGPSASLVSSTPSPAVCRTTSSLIGSPVASSVSSSVSSSLSTIHPQAKKKCQRKLKRNKKDVTKRDIEIKSAFGLGDQIKNSLSRRWRIDQKKFNRPVRNIKCEPIAGDEVKNIIPKKSTNYKYMKGINDENEMFETNTEIIPKDYLKIYQSDLLSEDTNPKSDNSASSTEIKESREFKFKVKQNPFENILKSVYKFVAQSFS